MVMDHFAVLKVGPALTFAYREAVFALSLLEEVLLPESERSNLVEVLDQVMLADPAYWRKYYHGDPAQQRFARLYSFSDRCRYYWPHPSLQAALERLLKNLRSRPLPLSLLSQYLPVQYDRIRQGILANTPEALIRDKIITVLEHYRKATAAGK
jgi:D-tagatose-1,6-bisphosphate aldolase subunit GatZ/KbaZ